MDLVTGFEVLTKGAHHMSGTVSKFGLAGKLIMVILLILWIALLIDCLQRKFKTDMDKIAWIIVLVFVPAVGAIVYIYAVFFLFKKKKRRR